MKTLHSVGDYVKDVMSSNLTSTEKFYFILSVLKFLNRVTIYCQVKGEIVVP